MKTNDLFLYGGIAVLAYLFLKPKTVAPGVTQVAPVNAYVPPPQQSSTANTVLTAAAGLVPVLANIFAPAPAATPLPVADLTAAQTIVTPDLTTQLPDVTPPDNFTSLELMEQAGIYPGSNLAGINNHTAAAIGEY